MTVNFLLAIIIAGAQSAQLYYADVFATEEECLIAKAEMVKQLIPRDVAVRYVASCGAVRNGADAES